MRWKYSVLASFLLLQALVVVACSSAPTITPTLAPVMTMAKPSASPTSNTTPIYTDVEEITSPKTRTSSPTSQPEQTSKHPPTQKVWTSLALPDWAADPDTPVLLGVYGYHPDYYTAPAKPLAMWNGLTGEQFDLDVPDAIGYYWLPDGSAFGLLSKDTTKAWEVDLASGIVTSYDVPGSSIQFTYFPSLSYVPLKVFPIPGQSGYSYWRSSDAVSTDGRFSVETTYDHKILVFDSVLGETFNLADPDSQLFLDWPTWSSTGDYLAVSRSDLETGHGFSTDGPANWSIAIYDVLARQLLTVYEDMFWVIWSPDGIKFLYQPPVENMIWYEPMCVFDRFTGESQCFTAPFINHKVSSSDHISFHDMRWLPDSRSFSYLYHTNGHHNETDYEKGGICFFRIEDGSERCILELIEQEGGVIGEGPSTVRYYWPSPDWQVIIFLADTACPSCDYDHNPRLGFVDIETGQSVMLDVYFEGSHILWRP